MNEVEKMYKLTKIAKPVIKKWYYDGYYEDFSWQSSEEDCTKLLKHFDNSIDKLNDRIQQMKKEENANYDRYTDSVMTEFGRVEKAYIDYPPFTAEKQLELIKWMVKTNHRYFIQEIIADDFSETLARVFNLYWQDLTEEEHKQVKGILE